MTKICTSLEQSKRFVELGIDVNTADMCISLFTIITNGNKEIKQVLLPLNYSKVTEYPAPDFIERFPCWSLEALLNVIPKHLKDYNVLRIDINENTFAIWYDEIGYGVNTELPDITMESAVDACVEMIIKLHELNLL